MTEKVESTHFHRLRPDSSSQPESVKTRRFYQPFEKNPMSSGRTRVETILILFVMLEKERFCVGTYIIYSTTI